VVLSVCKQVLMLGAKVVNSNSLVSQNIHLIIKFRLISPAKKFARQLRWVVVTVDRGR